MVNDIGKRFVGYLIDFGFAETCISNLDAFVHLSDVIDDYASTIKLKETTVFAKVREKAKLKNSLYEVSVYIGSLELLAVGGVVFYEDKQECFLGYSFKPLIPLMSQGRNVVSRTIYTKKAPFEVINSERLLRQYYKAHSSKLWSFHSKNLFNLGFFPTEPTTCQLPPSH
ncbi:hypothetical protein HMPREF1544_06976 [Mucor circinelloides 1006PhL]|uniref:Uncharacterized protein n=1 Tax=Mucor circinelloides f. circinelloides (strain 1006PhL) TaxID=1220926 RepID=S2JTX7_MUCC1|nr:hypothetical protein HMPREF1544_06976 [Mucor circinelloides 1006PhL]KAG1092181.1 hypothetical protein G6F42_019265 [Rhizopus arrhizus]